MMTAPDPITLTAPERRVDFLLWSNKHQMWWRPDSRGYTTEIDEAGRYDLGAAIGAVVQSAYHGDKDKVTLMVAAPEYYQDEAVPK